MCKCETVFEFGEPKIATEFLVRARREDESVPVGTLRMYNEAMVKKDQRGRLSQAQKRSRRANQMLTWHCCSSSMAKQT